MLESMTTEILVSGGLLGVSALIMAGGVAMMRGPRPEAKPIDIEAAVRRAPYHRLHNVLPSHGS